MKKKYKILLSGIIGFFVLSKDAFAYIDPGTGGIIAGSLWPLIVAFFSAIAAFLVKYFWKPIKKFFLKLFGKKKKWNE